MSVRQSLLIVENCAEDRVIYRRFLQQGKFQRYHILECETGKEALKLFQEKRVDGVLLNSHLPDMTGLEFLEAVKRLNWGEQGALPVPVLPPPIIILTTRSNEESATQALEQGAVDYLVKESLTPTRIYCTLHTAIREHQLKQELWATQAANTSLMAELRQKNQVLESSLETQKAILEAIPDGLIQVNRQRIRPELFNQHRVKSIKPELFTVGSSIYTVLPKLLADQRMAALLQILDTQEVQISEHALEVGGETRYEEARVVPCGADGVLGLERTKKAEVGLKQTWTAIEAASDAIAITTLQDGLPVPTYLNSALVQRFGYSLKDLMAAGGPALLHLNLPKFETLVGTALLGRPWMGEVRMQNRAGEQVDVLLRIDPIKNLQGQVTGLLAIHTDISKRHTAEQTLQQLNLKLETRVLERTAELEATNAQLQVEIEQRQQAEGRIRRSEAELRTMTEASPVGIFRTDPRGNISYVNQSLLDICGCSRTDMLNGSWIKTLDPKSRRAILQGWVQLLQGDQEFRDEVYLRRLDGGERWAVVKAVPFYDGLDLLGYVGTLDDISDRKSAEEALKESEGRFRSLVENAQDIIYSLNLEGRFTYVAPNWTRVLGHPISEVQGKLFEPFVHVDDLATCWQALQKLVASGQEQTDVEYRVLHQDGTWRWHISNVSGLTDRNGNVVMLVGIAHDITERRQAEQALRITNDQLRQANTELAQATRLKDEFLATMSHELRTPLNAVIGLSEGLLEEVYGPFNPRQQKALRTIERSGRHLLDLINDILDLSKIEAGKLELSVQPTLIYPLCETSIALIRPQAERKKINLTLSVTEAVTSIEVDERRIRQILINLLSNAVKFTPNSGSIRLEVCLEEREKTNSETALPSAVLLQVHDTGIGIAAEDLSKLFQPFSQIDTRLARSHSGTGLGLALVRRLAELHNGSVSVTSVVGEGSSFTVRIPLKHPWKDCVEWPTSTRALPTSKWAAETLCSPGSQTPGLAPLILLAEDNIANIEAIADFLKYEGYRVIYAQNGLEAFKQAKQHRPDCILMDVQMPLVDGLDATSRIRNDLDLANTPIIALTALAMPEDHDRCLQVGMTDYLTKPIRLKYLLSTIQKYLAHE